MSNKELKPCPFCGESAECIGDYVDSPISCSGCGAFVAFTVPKSDSAALWNARPRVLTFGAFYFFVDVDGTVQRAKFTGSSSDIGRLGIGNAFFTRAEAEANIEKIMTKTAEIKKKWVQE